MALATLLFLFGLVLALIGLVATDFVAVDSRFRKISRIASVIGVVVLVGGFLAILTQNFGGAEKTQCDSRGGLWVSEYNICIDKGQLPTLDYKTK